MPKGVTGLHAPISPIHWELARLSFQTSFCSTQRLRAKANCAFSSGPQKSLFTSSVARCFLMAVSQLHNVICTAFATESMLKDSWREAATSSPSRLIFPKIIQFLEKTPQHPPPNPSQTQTINAPRTMFSTVTLLEQFLVTLK